MHTEVVGQKSRKHTEKVAIDMSMSIHRIAMYLGTGKSLVLHVM